MSQRLGHGTPQGRREALDELGEPFRPAIPTHEQGKEWGNGPARLIHEVLGEQVVLGIAEVQGGIGQASTAGGDYRLGITLEPRQIVLSGEGIGQAHDKPIGLMA